FNLYINVRNFFVNVGTPARESGFGDAVPVHTSFVLWSCLLPRPARLSTKGMDLERESVVLTRHVHVYTRRPWNSLDRYCMAALIVCFLRSFYGERLQMAAISLG
ncbi:unnamed protein product, partial [Ectocarpus sp. 4 AP-2014]